MASITKEITVDVAKKNLFQAIIAKQYDSLSRFLKVTLANDGIKIVVEESSTVIINAERADEQSKSFAGEVNEDGTVTVPLTSWMLELDDTVKCDISIIDSESRKLTSTSFEVDVEEAANLNEEISSDENYDILVSLIGDVRDAIDSIPAIDQTYTPDSANPQSGVAVAEAIRTVKSPLRTHRTMLEEGNTETSIDLVTDYGAHYVVYSVNVRKATGEEILCDVDINDATSSGSEGYGDVTVRLSEPLDVPVVIRILYSEGEL